MNLFAGRGKRSKAIMFQEPKILPWLASRAGVPFAEAREIWRGIASQSDPGAKVGDVAGRQIRELRRQLKGRDGRCAECAASGSQLDWMFPLPLFQTWAEWQARVVLNAWLAWARATRSAQRSLPCHPAVGN
jgi:hypothetical protein